MAHEALRTICLAYKYIQETDDTDFKDNLGVYNIEKSELVLLGIFGIVDVIRQEVPKALE